MADENNVIISFKGDVKPINASLRELKKAILEAYSPHKTDEFQKAIDDTNKYITQQQKEVEKLNKLREKLVSGKLLSDDAKETKKQLDANVKALQALMKEREKVANSLSKEDARDINSHREFIKNWEDERAAYMNYINDVRSGVANVNEITKISTEMDGLKEKLADMINNQIPAMKLRVDNTTQAYENAKRRVEELVETVQQLATAEKTATNTKQNKLLPGLYISPDANKQLNDAAFALRNSQTSVKWAEHSFAELVRTITATQDKVQKLADQIARLEGNPELAGSFKNAQWQVERLTDRIKIAQECIDDLYGPIKEQLDNIDVKLDETTAKGTKLNEVLETQKSEAITEVIDEVAHLEDNIEKAEKGIEQIAKTATTTIPGISGPLKRLSKSIGQFVSRFKNMAIRSLFYQTFGKAIRGFIQYINKAIEADDELAYSVGRLKAEFAVTFQYIWNVIGPILKRIVNYITKIVSMINRLLALITGRSVESATEAAKALDAYGNSIKNAADEAERSLAPFDELNQIGDKSKDSGTDSSGIPLQFDSKPFETTLGDFEVKLAGFMLAIGTLLTLSGLNIPLGLTLMALGAATMWAAKKLDWGAADEQVKQALARVLNTLGTLEMAVGLILMLNPTSFPYGLFLLISGAIMKYQAAQMQPGLMSAKVEGALKAVMGLLGPRAIAVGLFMLATGYLGIGLGLLLAGGIAELYYHGYSLDELYFALFNAWLKIRGWYQKNVSPYLQKGYWKEKLSNLPPVVEDTANIIIDIINGVGTAVVALLNVIGELSESPRLIGMTWKNIPHLSFSSLAGQLFGSGHGASNTIASSSYGNPVSSGNVIPTGVEGAIEAYREEQKKAKTLDFIKEFAEQTMASGGNVADAAGRMITIKFAGNMAQLVRSMNPYLDTENGRSGISIDGTWYTP